MTPSLRLDYIDWRLLTEGEVSRQAIAGDMGVGISQATADLKAFVAAHKGASIYDLTRKRYVPAHLPYRSRRGMDTPEADAAMRWLIGRMQAA